MQKKQNKKKVKILSMTKLPNISQNQKEVCFLYGFALTLCTSSI